jgi:hypothetical protein
VLITKVLFPASDKKSVHLGLKKKRKETERWKKGWMEERKGDRKEGRKEGNLFKYN